MPKLSNSARLRSTRPRVAITLLTAAATLVSSTPALAWKPKTHVYLAEQALKDALDDGKVTIYATDFAGGTIRTANGAPVIVGEYKVDPRVLDALRTFPAQFRAGVLGPDAYPDIATGQQIIHPAGSRGPGETEVDLNKGGLGPTAWLSYLYSRAFSGSELHVGRWEDLSRMQFGQLKVLVGVDQGNKLHIRVFAVDGKRQDYDESALNAKPAQRDAVQALKTRLPGLMPPHVLNNVEIIAVLEQLTKALEVNPMQPDGIPDSTPANRAFVVGYLTHAAGDVYGHTLINYYTGDAFHFTPSKNNAIKHIVLEGYVALKTPDPTYDAKIDEGVDGFIYRNMVNARPGSVLYQQLLSPGENAKFSVPFVFSAMRDELARGYTDEFAAKIEALEKQGKTMQEIVNALQNPVAYYKLRWVKDIDDGLRAWPQLSHEVAKSLFFSAGNQANLDRVQTLFNDYANQHLISMLGAPKFVGLARAEVQTIIDAVLTALYVKVVQQVIDDIKRSLYDFILMKAFGMTTAELQMYLTSPDTLFDPVMQNLANFNEGYDVRVVPSWGNGPGLPTDRNLVFAGAEGVRVRVIDANGAQTNVDASSLSSRTKEQDHAVAVLKYQLPRLLPPHALSRVERGLILGEVGVLLKQTLPGRGVMISRANFDRDVLHLTGATFFDYKKVPAAYNTVVMTKLLMMDKDEIGRLMRDLSSGQTLQYPNAMIGFAQTLDGSFQWSANPGLMIVAQDQRAYQKIFMRLPGEAP